MATQTQRFSMLKVCSYNKFGYCKHKEHCRKQHVKELCEKKSCDISNCSLRHPKTCKFYRDYGRCKFNPCMFRHIDNTIDLVELRKENEKIVKIIQSIDDRLEDLEAKIVVSEDLISKLCKVEEKLVKISQIEKAIFEKDCRIDALTKKVEEIQDEKDANIIKLEERILKTESILNKHFNKKSKTKINCNVCDFEASSQQGLKVHMKRKHTLTGTEQYPRKCDVCELILDNQKDLKTHMKTHSYKRADYQCIDCDFCGDSPRTMNVHLGKHHLDTFECGLCDSDYPNLDDLELHLFTCEMYECYETNCEFKVKTLSEIKHHIRGRHEAGTFLHLKMNRINTNKVESKGYGVSKDSDED